MLSEVDHRKFDAATVTAWHGIIGDLDYNVAMEATRDAARNNTIQYIEPKHILAHAQAVKYRLERAEAKKTLRDSWQGDPSPDNMTEMTEAYRVFRRATKAGDVDAIEEGRRRVAVEVTRYHDQLRAAGIEPLPPLR